MSYYAEAHLSASSAQNTRFLACALLEHGHDVRVVCAGAKGETIWQEGYLLTKIPITSPDWKTGRYGAWQPDQRIRAAARAYFQTWQPDVIYVGAWNHLSDFVMLGYKLRVPIVQLVHDYSILCMRQWLVDSWGNLCSGPTSTQKCLACIRHGLGWKGQAKSKIQALPALGLVASIIWPDDGNEHQSVKSSVTQAIDYMQTYRDRISLYIAQSPSVMDVLRVGGVGSERFRFIPQYIGEEKLERYPRAKETAGRDRPVRLIYVGRWSTEKGVDLLLDAYAKAETPEKLELWIVSRNAREESIMAALSGRLTENRSILVFNDLNGRSVSEKLAQADVAVVPSTCMELASRIVLEANAQQTPVIASSTVGNRYVIEDEDNGKIFESGSVLALRTQIERIAAEPQLTAAWSKNVAPPISKDDWVEQMLSVFDEAIQSSHEEKASR